jgi:hypothetical protein
VPAGQWQLEQLPPWQPPQPPDEPPLALEDDAPPPPAEWLTHAESRRFTFPEHFGQWIVSVDERTSSSKERSHFLQWYS